MSGVASRAPSKLLRPLFFLGASTTRRCGNGELPAGRITAGRNADQAAGEPDGPLSFGRQGWPARCLRFPYERFSVPRTDASAVGDCACSKACRIWIAFTQSGAQGDADGGVLFWRAEGIAVFGGHGDELGQFIGRWRALSAGPGDRWKESPEPRGGDDQLHRRLSDTFRSACGTLAGIC